MGTSFKSVSLDEDFGDSGSMLVFREDRLAAIISCLGEQHGPTAGRWYVEANFSALAAPMQESFASLKEVEAWLVAKVG